MKNAAVILAAGQGTRMKSKYPKVTHKILEKPLVRWVVDAARNADVDAIVTVVGHGRDMVAPLVEDTTVVVQEEQRGTAHAVLSAQQACSDIDGSIVVLRGDSPLVTAKTIKKLIDLREQEKAAVVVLTMELADPFGYGRIVRDVDGAVVKIVEEKDCTDDERLITECNSGFYCFDAPVLFDALTQVSTDNAQGEYYLPDVLAIAQKAGKKVIALTAKDPAECMGVNSRIQLAEATKVAQKRINTKHMEAGVTLVDPATTWIGPEVVIGQDSIIYPSCSLMGATTVGSDCVIGPLTRLMDTTVGDCCTLEETIALETVIENEVDCGPRCYLRPLTHLCNNAKVGTHVEIKKSTIGVGSKVPHLSYIGDATLGTNVNIGAGSITCNYDGEKKWPTTIGDDVFVGSDTMMVAPVSLGDDSIIGAGSVITSDVPPHALGLGRARQTVIEGYRLRNKD